MDDRNRLHNDITALLVLATGQDRCRRPSDPEASEADTISHAGCAGKKLDIKLSGMVKACDFHNGTAISAACQARRREVSLNPCRTEPLR